jgi:hypothetical protein
MSQREQGGRTSYTVPPHRNLTGRWSERARVAFPHIGDALQARNDTQTGTAGDRNVHLMTGQAI